jgi:hypothetical protein
MGFCGKPVGSLGCFWRRAAVSAIAAGLWAGAAQAQQQTLRPIPAAECQSLAAQIQTAAGFAMKAGEDDFTDLVSGADGRSCHIAGSASGQTISTPAELIAKIAAVFGSWQPDPSRSDDGPSGAIKGYVSGNRIAEVDVSWEPGPGVTCSDKQSLTTCNVAPQQKLWNVMIDIVQK